MIKAEDRLARLIAAIPWIVAQDGAPVDEIVERFDYPRDLLLADLMDVVFFVGVPPYTPDTLIDVLIDDDTVWIDYADWFERPMKLSGAELLALLTAGEIALSFDNHDEAGPLARGLTKLRLASGRGAAVDVQFSSTDRTYLPALRSAADNRTLVEIDYYSFARNSRSTRLIEPDRFFVVEGNWYVGGYCHLAEADRIFRVDRIDDLSETSEPFSSPTSAAVSAGDPAEMFSISDAPRATITMPASAMGALDGQVDSIVEAETGELTVTLPVSSKRWLEHLLVRLGPGVSVVSDGGVGVDPGAAAANMLTRYGVVAK